MLQSQYKSIELLKLLAAFSMVVDHASIVWGYSAETYIIGRLAWPIYAFLLGVGSVSTSKPSRQLERLLAYAVIAQFPYMLVVSDSLNVLFTLLAGAVLLNLRSVSPVWLLTVPLAYFADGGIFGALAVYSAGSIRKSTYWLPVYVFCVGISTGFNVYALLMAALVPFILKLPAVLPRLPWWFHYSVYPAHLLVLLVVSLASKSG